MTDTQQPAYAPAVMSLQTVARYLDRSISAVKFLIADDAMPRPVGFKGKGTVNRFAMWSREHLDHWVLAGCPRLETWRVEWGREHGTYPAEVNNG